MERKLVVLGIPYDVDTKGLKEYMSKYGEIEDCIVMKERSSGRSRGFGYVTFKSEEDAKEVLSKEHTLGSRTLEVKVATPKADMNAASKKITRIFVAKISPSVTESNFRSYFGKYGEITDLYMPKDHGSKNHRGIGFITFASSDSVDKVMSESHELGGSCLVVDRATPKDEDFKPAGRPWGGYGAYDAYVSNRYPPLGAPAFYEHPGLYAREYSRKIEKKIFVGRLPQEATAEDLRKHFARFGHVVDVYVPKDSKRSGHRGFGFVTFSDSTVADRVSRRPHEICGHQVAIDSATPVEDTSPPARFPLRRADPFDDFGGYNYGPGRGYGRMFEGLDSYDYDDWRYVPARPSRFDMRYRPY